MNAPPVIYDPPHDDETCPNLGRARDAKAWGRYAYETAGRLRAGLIAVRELLPSNHRGYALINELLKVDAKPRVYLSAAPDRPVLLYHVREACALDSPTNPVRVPAFVAEMAGEPCERCVTPDDLTRAKVRR